MTNTEKKGICLSTSGEYADSRSHRIMQGLTSFAAFCALMFIFIDISGFGGKNEIIAMMLTGLYLHIMYILLGKGRRQGWFYVGSLLLLLILTIIANRQIAEGIRLIWNALGEKWTEHNGTLLTELELQLPQSEHSLCGIVISVALAGIISIVCCALTSKTDCILAVILLAALFITPVVLKAESTPFCVIIVLSAAVFVLAGCGWKRGKEVRPTVVTSIICSLLAVGFTMICVLPAAKQWSDSIAADTKQYIHKNRYETDFTTLPEGDFTDFTPYSGDAVPALIVSMDNPEETYLRGFVGCTFEDGKWSSVENSLLADNSELLYWLSSKEFNPAAQFEAASDSLDYTRNTVTVQNLGACSEYVYVPYNVNSDSIASFIDAKILNTDSVWANGNRTYIYSLAYGGEGIISETLDMLQSSEDDDVLMYRVAESAYRKYVYNTYLNISQDMQQILEELYDEVGIDYENADSLTKEQAQEKVLTFLSLCFGEKSEDIELPLENIDGTSYQYATVAALALRSFGIPSRYAEGYVISESMAEKAEGGESITVDSSCAHSWVEVYQDGIGWIPMDMTPGLGEMTREENLGTTTNTSSPKVDEGKELEEQPKENEPEPEPLGGTLVKIGKTVFRTLITVISILIIIILFLVIRRKILRNKRKKLYSGECVGEAVAWIFGDTALLLNKMGFDNGNGSMRLLSENITEEFGEDYGRKYDEMVELNGRAIFSSKPMEEEKRETAIEFLNITVSNLKLKVKRYKQLWMKWIRCLY